MKKASKNDSQNLQKNWLAGQAHAQIPSRLIQVFQQSDHLHDYQESC